MRFIYRFGAYLSIAALTLGVTATHAGATTPPQLQCGSNPTTDVVLTADLTCAQSFVIGDSNSATPIDIDLGGHTLTVTSPDAPCRFNQPFVGCAVLATGPVRIHDGTIVGSVGFASVLAGSHAFQLTVQGDLWLSGIGGIVQHSTVEGGSIKVFSASTTVSRDVVTGGGIMFDDTDSQLAISIVHNVVSSSPGAGIQGVLGHGGQFQNDVTGEIRGNAVKSASGSGISLTGALTNFGAFTLFNNHVSGSGGDGIQITGLVNPVPPYLGGPVTLTMNRLVDSAGYGVNAPWVANMTGTGIVDGGDNHAVRSGLAPCVGVVC